MGNTSTPVSVVVLTYSRPDEIRNNVKQLLALQYAPLDIVVVDNASEIPVDSLLPADPRLKVLRMEENKGVGGRNHGINVASGDIVITVDDDVTGLTDKSIAEVVSALSVADVAAVNFRVVDAETGEQINWCHHRRLDKFANRHFDTYEISEGAVAFRRQVVIDAGMYPEFYFISHEGPDLALRIMDLGYRVTYNPAITVWHSHSETARISWRRYYYDTRNQIWLVVRLLPVFTAARKLVIGLGAMSIYSLRDGYFRYWAKGIYHAIIGLPGVYRVRKCISARTLERYREIERFNPGIFYMLGKRLFRRKVGI